ncbi:MULTISPECIES: carboxymuconolactone decarboxylase family protein [Bacteroidota]
MNAQDNNTKLSSDQQSLAAISALTATGDLENLKISLNRALDSGVTVNEIKEAIVQLYAYCGFPRSLNALGVFQTLLNERKQAGITDKMGKDIVIENKEENKYEQGRKVLEALTQTPQTKPAPGFGEFAPRIDAFLKEHLFADIFASNVLTFQQRELVTISALAAMTGTSGQLQAHIGMGMNTGITKDQVKAIFDIVEEVVSREQAEIARALLLKN